MLEHLSRAPGSVACAEIERLASRGAVLIVAAHPDDEVIGAGGLLASLGDVWIAHVTDGSPRDLKDAARHGFGSRAAYAGKRRAELRAALAIAGVPESRALEIGLVDQEASLHLAGLACALADLLLARRPALVLAQPYEGGHPDHDAVAFGVSGARHVLRALAVDPPPIWEMTSYHHGPDGIRVAEFLPNGGGVHGRILTAREREMKREMIRCFTTQEESLRGFPVDIERFRPAPGYDFTRAPHEGALFYERFDWGMTGETFRGHARRALEALGQRPG